MFVKQTNNGYSKISVFSNSLRYFVQLVVVVVVLGQESSVQRTFKVPSRKFGSASLVFQNKTQIFFKFLFETMAWVCGWTQNQPHIPDLCRIRHNCMQCAVAGGTSGGVGCWSLCDGNLIWRVRRNESSKIESSLFHSPLTNNFPVHLSSPSN